MIFNQDKVGSKSKKGVKKKKKIAGPTDAHNDNQDISHLKSN